MNSSINTMRRLRRKYNWSRRNKEGEGERNNSKGKRRKI